MRTWLLVIIAISQTLAGVAPAFAAAAADSGSAHCESGMTDSAGADHVTDHQDEAPCMTDCQMCVACGIALQSHAVSQNFDAAGFYRPVSEQEPHAQPIELLFRPPI